MSFDKTTRAMRSVHDQLQTDCSEFDATITGNRAKRFEARTAQGAA